MASVNGNIHEHLTDFSNVKFKRVLSEVTERKMVIVEASVDNSPDPAVMIIEKLPWKEEDLVGMLTKDTVAKQQFNNDIYGQYSILPSPEHNSVKCNLIHPATQKHIDKYLTSPGHLVHETAELYRTVTLPHIMSQQFSLQWVYNVLEHKKEAERIIFEDPDPETGFILAPDFKWTGESVSDLYCLAIVHKRDVKSLRDLNTSHLPLLRNIQSQCVKAVNDKYELEPSQLRLYLHYQPSYYHLHVHVTSVLFTPPGSGCDKGHLLDTVIANIEMDPAYYQKATLSFVVYEKDKLYQKYKDADYFNPGAASQRDWISSDYESGNCETTRKFFEMLGQAKHEPCGEFWETTYGESAWRMCIMALCLSSDSSSVDMKRLIGLCLSSSLTSLGDTNDENTEWTHKIADVTQVLEQCLPVSSATLLSGLFQQHALVRRGKLDGSKEQRLYRSVLEMEETLLRWEEEAVFYPPPKLALSKQKF